MKKGLVSDKKKRKNMLEIKKEIIIQEIKKQPVKIKDIKFEEVFDSPEIEDSSPSLNRINAQAKESPRLEENLIKSSVFDGKKTESDSFKYNTFGGNGEEKKYHQYDGAVTAEMINKGEISQLGRITERKGVEFNPSQDARIDRSRNFEKYNLVQKEDISKIGRENIFERKEIKYKSSR